jgi:hypothetical protein
LGHIPLFVSPSPVMPIGLRHKRLARRFLKGCVMGVEYVAAIRKHNYKGFKIIITTGLPSDYDMWLRVRDRAKLRALNEGGKIVTEVFISPLEFARYCRGLKRPDFSIASLDACARAKALGPEKIAVEERSRDRRVVVPQP